MSQNSNGFLPIFCLLSSFFPEIPCLLSGWRARLQCRRHRRSGFDPWFGGPPWGVSSRLLQHPCLERLVATVAWGATVQRAGEAAACATAHGQPRVTRPSKSYCHTHICMFSPLRAIQNVRLSATCFLFFSLLLSQSSVVQKQMTPKLSHLKQLLSLGSGGWVGLGDFLMWWQGSVLGLASPQHVWELSWGCRPEYLPVACLLVWVPQQHVAGFKHEWPQDTRQRPGGFLWPTPRSSEIASVMLKSQACTDLRRESQCQVLTRICWNLVAILENTLIFCTILWSMSSFFLAISTFHWMDPVNIFYQF